jgi:hypothetical protein
MLERALERTTLGNKCTSRCLILQYMQGVTLILRSYVCLYSFTYVKKLLQLQQSDYRT